MVATPMLLFADYEPVSVKDSRFGAVGDFAADDTAALQAALDHCFGSAARRTAPPIFGRTR